jgi:hypothetical protein
VPRTFDRRLKSNLALRAEKREGPGGRGRAPCGVCIIPSLNEYRYEKYMFVITLHQMRETVSECHKGCDETS